MKIPTLNPHYRASLVLILAAAILAALGLFVLGGVILGSALAGDPLPVPGWDGQGEAVISGIVLLLAGIAAWRFFEKIPTGAAKQGSN